MTEATAATGTAEACAELFPEEAALLALGCFGKSVATAVGVAFAGAAVALTVAT